MLLIIFGSTFSLHMFFRLFFVLKNFLKKWHHLGRTCLMCTSTLWLARQTYNMCTNSSNCDYLLCCVWNVMAHAQKPDFVFRRNGGVHLNWLWHQFGRLLAAEVFASAVVMLDTPCSEVVWRVLATHSIRVSPSLPLPCVSVCHHISTGLYNMGRGGRKERKKNNNKKKSGP